FGNMGFSKGEEFGFWPMVLGGFFLYASYYGTNQSQAQRLFSADKMQTVKHTLLANGLMRFPITLIYCLMGLVLGTLFMQTPELLSQVPAEKPDLMIPVFIKTQLPHGVIGLLMVAIFSAAMSSLSSVINSLSAASVEDFFNRDKQLPDGKYLSLSRYASIFWGCVCIVLAFFTGNIADTVIEAINKIGSVFYGPILATFVAAVGIRRVNGQGANIGLVAGVITNIILWLFFPQVFWFWWNMIGFVVTMAVGLLWSFLSPIGTSMAEHQGWAPERDDLSKVMVLMIFFVLILAISIGFPLLF
ncbi:MAG: sodium transporter, partial [Bacteroidota bacterium]